MATAWSRPNDGDSTFLMFWVKFARVTTLLGGREIAPAAEVEAYLWARRQIKALERGRAAWRGLIGYGLLVVDFSASCTQPGRECRNSDGAGGVGTPPSSAKLLAVVRKLAWAIVVLLLLVSAALLLRYAAIYAGLTGPEFMRGLRQIAASAHLIPAQAGELLASVRVVRSHADLALYLGVATGLLATLAFIIVAATHRLRRDEYDEYEENDDDDPGPQTCPECNEPIKGFAITCRACGYGFGPRFESRGRRR